MMTFMSLKYTASKTSICVRRYHQTWSKINQNCIWSPSSKH